MPGVFPPVSIEGRLLIDGGVVDPIPCRVARELGADIVLGVSLEVASTPGGTDRSPDLRGTGPRRPTWPAAMLHASNLVQQSLARRCLQEADVPIRVFTRPVGMADFRGGPQFAEAGERAVEAAVDHLGALLPWARVRGA
jgi:predicted acylesterase/phospholipase RssA